MLRMCRQPTDTPLPPMNACVPTLLQDYYTGEMRGIGFVEFADERSAEDAQRGLDRMFLEGREVSCLS